MGAFIIYGTWIAMCIGMLYLFATGQVNIIHMLILAFCIYFLSTSIDRAAEVGVKSMRQQYMEKSK